MPGRTVLAAFFLLVLGSALVLGYFSTPSRAGVEDSVSLPEVTAGEEDSLSYLLFQRSSVRQFGDEEIGLEEVTRVAFSAQGITRQGRFRTVPSAGATYPIEVYVAVGEVQGLEEGIYRYRPHYHDLVLVREGDKRRELARAALGQYWIDEAQTVFVLGAVYERVTDRYGPRGERYAHIEVGCSAQSMSLKAAELGMGTTLVGAFHDDQVRNIIGDDRDLSPLLVMPVGLLAQ